MPELAWVGFLLVALPTLLYWPVHFLLGKLPARRGLGTAAGA